MIIVVASYYVKPKLIIKILQFLTRLYRFGLEVCIVVDNKNLNSGIYGDQFFVISGNNSLHDFSAYYEALKFLERKNIKHEAIIFLNDSIFTKHSFALIIWRLIRFSRFGWRFSTAAIIGVCASYKSVVFANPISGANVFVSSSAFVLNAKAIALFQDAYEKKLYEFHDSRFETFVDLHMSEAGYSINIYEAVSAYSDEKRAVKKNAIKFEHYLSGVVHKHGVVVPINSTKIERYTLYLTKIFTKAINKLIKVIGA